jgi:hypothetical protein
VIVVVRPLSYLSATIRASAHLLLHPQLSSPISPGTDTPRLVWVPIDIQHTQLVGSLGPLSIFTGPMVGFFNWSFGTLLWKICSEPSSLASAKSGRSHLWYQ